MTGTETALLAAAAAPGVTELRHAACEPHVVEVCRFLETLGVGIEGAGSSTVRVHGGARLGGGTHRLNGDYLEAGSWAVVAAVTRGCRRRGRRPRRGPGAADRGARSACRCSAASTAICCASSRLTPAGIGRIATGLWPGFPSDFVSLIAVLATQASGRTLIHDWMYELRLFALEQLSGMGADFFLCDPHRIIVTGRRGLRGRALDGRDLRSGMALIAAALAADGESARAAARDGGARLRARRGEPAEPRRACRAGGVRPSRAGAALLSSGPREHRVVDGALISIVVSVIVIVWAR